MRAPWPAEACRLESLAADAGGTGRVSSTTGALHPGSDARSGRQRICRRSASCCSANTGRLNRRSCSSSTASTEVISLVDLDLPCFGEVEALSQQSAQHCAPLDTAAHYEQREQARREALDPGNVVLSKSTAGKPTHSLSRKPECPRTGEAGGWVARPALRGSETAEAFHPRFTIATRIDVLITSGSLVSATSSPAMITATERCGARHLAPKRDARDARDAREPVDPLHQLAGQTNDAARELEVVHAASPSSGST